MDDCMMNTPILLRDVRERTCSFAILSCALPPTRGGVEAIPNVVQLWWRESAHNYTFQAVRTYGLTTMDDLARNVGISHVIIQIVLHGR